MLKALLPVDGSECALRAIQHAMKLAKSGEPLEIHLINVQPPFHGDVATFVGRKTVESYHREEGEKALDAAKRALDAAGVAYKTHIGVGPPAETIVEFARRLGIDKIVMGTRGLGGLAGLLLGSVASEIIRLSDVPVTLVK